MIGDLSNQQNCLKAEKVAPSCNKNLLAIFLIRFTKNIIMIGFCEQKLPKHGLVAVH